SRIAGMRCRNQSERSCFTRARHRSEATNDFFVAIAQLAQKAPDRGRMGTDAGRILKRPPQFDQGHVGILFQQFLEKVAMRRQLSMAPGATLWCRARIADGPNQTRPSRPRRRRQLQARRCRSSAQTLLDVALKPNTKRRWQWC